METTTLSFNYDVTTDYEDNSVNVTTAVSMVSRSGDFIRHTFYRVNLVLAGILTSFGMVNLFVLWSLLKFCPIRRTFNMYAVLICVADLINNLIVGPMYMATWISPQLLTVNLCKARTFIKVMSQLLSLAVALLIAVTRLLSVVNSRLFKRLLRTKAVLGSVIVIEILACLLGVQLIADDGQILMVCMQRPIYRGVPRDNHITSLIVWVVFLVAVILSYVALVTILRYKNLKIKQLPGNQHMILVTFKIGMCISAIYFLFVLSPIIVSSMRSAIYARFNISDTASLQDRLAIGELFNTIVLLHSCVNPLLYILPSSSFRKAFCKHFRKKLPCFHSNNAVAPASNEHNSAL